jgi:hypothetical protein
MASAPARSPAAIALAPILAADWFQLQNEIYAPRHQRTMGCLPHGGSYDWTYHRTGELSDPFVK